MCADLLARIGGCGKPGSPSLFFLQVDGCSVSLTSSSMITEYDRLGFLRFEFEALKGILVEDDVNLRGYGKVSHNHYA
jgi:hypothetical protein